MATVVDDKQSADIAKLKAQTELIQAQNAKLRAEWEQRFQLDLQKIQAETAKINREIRWYPLAASGAIIAGFLAVIVTLIFKLIHG